MKKKRVLYITQEMLPYIEESEIASVARHLPQGIQQKGKEIRVFMPRYGSINERRNQLHEVIRLSGMNLIIDDNDHPLIIKVASIQAARMQVYFIDNEEFFQRKAGLVSKKGEFFEDNDERAIFYCRGVLETVKKLGWTPDVIHCHGWMTSFVPLFIKKVYNEDPIFKDSKVVTSLYNTPFEGSLNKMAGNKAVLDGIDIPDVGAISDPTFVNLNNFAADWSDALIYGSEEIDDKIKTHVESLDKPILSEFDRENYTDEFDTFYDEVIEGVTVDAN
jgi:starch synthase